MQMTHEEYKEIETQLQDHFDGRYRKIDDCDSTIKDEQSKIEELKKQFGDMRVEQAKTNTRLGILIGILGAIAVPILAITVKVLFGG